MLNDSEMPRDDRYRRSEDVAFRQVGEECLLVPIRRSPQQDMSVFALNGVGAFLWESLGESRSVGELTARVAAEFEVSEPQAEADVESFVARLLSRKLAQRVEA